MNFIKKLLKDDNDLYDEKYKSDYTDDERAGDGVIDDIPSADDLKLNEQRGVDGGVSLRVMRPKSYDDGPEIADYVAGGCTVVMNIEDLNRENSRRLIDFLLGAVHVIGGDLQMASQTTFVVAPSNIDVNDDDDVNGGESSVTSGGFSFK